MPGLSGKKKIRPISPSQVIDVSINGLPSGYRYGVTRYADVILDSSFPNRLADITRTLDCFHPDLEELKEGGGGRTQFTKRFDDSLSSQLEQGNLVWGKKNITITKSIGFDDHPVVTSKVRGHEIDVFGVASPGNPFPGVAVEMEWNNKDPFFDRDLNNFQALHREGAIAVGVIVTRGPALQELLCMVLDKYGSSSTHWGKLIPKVNLGGGGECPLLLIGIEPERIVGIERAQLRQVDLERAREFKETWREKDFDSWDAAKSTYYQLIESAQPL